MERTMAVAWRARLWLARDMTGSFVAAAQPRAASKKAAGDAPLLKKQDNCELLPETIRPDESTAGVFRAPACKSILPQFCGLFKTPAP
jgi:hypothetical protein